MKTKPSQDNNIQAYLVGKKIYLRLLNKRDINKRYLSWLNDTEVTKYMISGLFPSTRKDLEDYYKKVHESKTDIQFAIIEKENNLHIGNIKLGSINWVHRFADLGIMIGEKKYWHGGRGQEACRLLLEYAFKRLNLNKVILGVYENHISAIESYQGIGFVIEGRIKDFLYFEGKYIDRIIMGISQKEFLKTIKS